MATSDLRSELAPGTMLRGRLSGQGDVRVGGEVIGEVEVQGRVIIAAGGHVQSEVLIASSVIVEGELDAEVRADRLEVRAGGALRGRVVGGSLVIQPGAIVTAEIDMPFES